MYTERVNEGVSKAIQYLIKATQDNLAVREVHNQLLTLSRENYSKVIALSTTNENLCTKYYILDSFDCDSRIASANSFNERRVHGSSTGGSSHFSRIIRR